MKSKNISDAALVTSFNQQKNQLVNLSTLRVSYCIIESKERSESWKDHT